MQNSRIASLDLHKNFGNFQLIKGKAPLQLKWGQVLSFCCAGPKPRWLDLLLVSGVTS